MRDFDTAYVCFGSEADITRHLANVRFAPKVDIRSVRFNEYTP
jgi:hypothetical protein